MTANVWLDRLLMLLLGGLIAQVFHAWGNATRLTKLESSVNALPGQFDMKLKLLTANLRHDMAKVAGRRRFPASDEDDAADVDGGG